VPRVASLIASSTEIVCALGAEAMLVGRSHECDFPPSVRALPVLTEPKFPVEGSSREIDRRVKDLLRDALSVYRVFPDRVAAARPEVILTQTQCEVCAVSLRDVELAVCGLVTSRPRIVALEPNGLADVFADIARVAGALGLAARGEALAADMRRRMDAIASRARVLPPCTVTLVEWIDPLMAAGNWMPTLAELAGARAVGGGVAGAHSPWMTFDALVAADPDAIVVLPCGFDLDRTRAELAPLLGHPGFPALRAARAERVFLADGNQYFNRPGPRLVESLEILAEILHPEAFAFGHVGRAWERVAL
jgi:iron complex transport system substrate-binding protein